MGGNREVAAKVMRVGDEDADVVRLGEKDSSFGLAKDGRRWTRPSCLGVSCCD